MQWLPIGVVNRNLQPRPFTAEWTKENRMKPRLFTAALSALLLCGVSAFAQSSSWTIDSNHSQVNFQIRHMGVSNVRGSISGATGTVVWDAKDPSKSSVETTITTKTVSTNN